MYGHVLKLHVANTHTPWHKTKVQILRLMSITLCSQQQQRRAAAACQALAGTHHHHPLLLTRCPRTMWLMVAIKRSISDRAVNEFGEDTDTSAFTLEKLSNI